MKYLRLSPVITLFLIFLNSCNTDYKSPACKAGGLWITTEATSSLFEPWAQSVALHISKDSTDALKAHAYFLKSDDSWSEWTFVNADYNLDQNKLTLLDEDMDTLYLFPESENSLLKGSVHTQNNIIKKIEFLPADKELETRLLHPRLPDINRKITYTYSKPEQIDDGLTTASIYNFGVTEEVINNFMDKIINQDYGRLKSLLILKDNKLVLEEYFYGSNREQTHNIHSCTKSVTSLLFGIMLDHYKNVNVDQYLFDFFSQYDSLKTGNKSKITLKHVLTMSAGFNDHHGAPEQNIPDNLYEYILSKPLKTPPGEAFKYSNWSTDLIGGVIQSVTGKRADEFSEESLFPALGIKKYSWQIEDGFTHCYSDLRLLPRDMAKIGLLVLNDGKWQGKQIVSSSWIRESTQPHVHESIYYDYGYQWWHHSKNTVQWWKEPQIKSPKEHDLVTALGFGGQYIMIIRDFNLVIVTTATDYSNGHIARSKVPMAIEEIIPIFETEK